jgi:neutral amino acid transport system ATP-binding protein
VPDGDRPAPAEAADRLAGVPAEPGVAKPDPILVADSVRRRFEGVAAVDVDHLEVQRGVVTALIGPNGAGKTTLFNLLTGFDRADMGTWTFEGRKLEGTPAYKVATLGMVRTFQLTRSLAVMSVLDNMKLGAQDQQGESFCVRCGVPRSRMSRPGPTSCSSASGSGTCGSTSPVSCRAGSASCWRWPGL